MGERVLDVSIRTTLSTESQRGSFTALGMRAPTESARSFDLGLCSNGRCCPSAAMHDDARRRVAVEWEVSTAVEIGIERGKKAHFHLERDSKGCRSTS